MLTYWAMRKGFLGALTVLLIAACGGSPPAQTPQNAGSSGPTPASSGSGKTATKNAPPKEGEFQVHDSTTAGSAHGVNESKIKPTKTEAAMKFFVIDKGEDKPIAGIVIAMVSKDGKKYYTDETDALGYAEVLVPIGQEYDIVYLSLGKADVNASVTVKDLPNQNIKLTLKYKKRHAAPAPAATAAAPAAPQPGFILEGVTFPSGKATILPESFPRLDTVVEFMMHKKSARIVISGHTDNVGNSATNKALSEKRAQACRDYLRDKGIDPARIDAVGFGDEQPIAPNTSEEGRQKNRRIEAKELLKPGLFTLAEASVTRLILLPGMDGTGELFRPLIRSLPKSVSANVVVYPASEFSYDSLYRLVVEHIRQQVQSSGQRVVVVAESFSGPIAIRVALENREYVESLVLVASFVSCPRPRLIRLAIQLGPAIFSLSLPRKVVQAVMLDSSCDESLVSQTQQIVNTVLPETMIARIKEVSVVDVREKLAQCDVPILAIEASHDYLVPSGQLDEIRRIAPRAKTVVVQGPHLLLQAKPNQCWVEIYQFLANSLAEG